MICQGICMLHSIASVPQHTHASAWLPPHADNSTCLCTCPPLCRHDRCAGMCAGRRGGRTTVLSPASWCCQPGSGHGGTGLLLGQKGVPPSPEHLAMAPCVPLCWARGVCPMHASACGHDTALSHVRSPEPQGALRQLEEAWLQAGRAEGWQGVGCWGGDSITPGLLLPAP